jgi:hypothetical protein
MEATIYLHARGPIHCLSSFRADVCIVAGIYIWSALASSSFSAHLLNEIENVSRVISLLPQHIGTCSDLLE